uniref:Uncharacterized protein n=1 Tax=Arundo donax TaxID=35708 RepID=A0A0A8Y8Z7_ARUDO
MCRLCNPNPEPSSAMQVH